MATKRTPRMINYNGFFGIDLRKNHTGKENLQDITNFMIREDDSLEKRNGYMPLFTAPAPVRAVWSGMLNGHFSCFFVAGSTAYSLHIESKTATPLGEVMTDSGKASFFYYKEQLFLIDELRLYTVTADSCTLFYGYVPFYGKDWTTTFAGEVFEQPNMMNATVRITYTVPFDYTALFPIGRSLESIISIYKNGVLLDPSAYEYDDFYHSIKIPGVVEGDKVDALVVLGMTEERHGFITCPSATAFGGVNNNNLFVWGGSAANKMYINTPPTEEQMQSVAEYFPDCGNFYFPEGTGFTVGDGQYRITAVSRQFGRLLIFTDGDVWMADSDINEDGILPMITVNSTAGCAKGTNIVKIGNDPISVGKQAILRWTTETEELNECNAYSISGAIESGLDKSFFDGASLFIDQYRNELWIHNPTLNSPIWVYNIQKKAWVKLSSFNPTVLFDANGKVGFAEGCTVYCFSPECFEDIHADGSRTEIVGSVDALNMDFEISEKKRLSKISLSGNCGGGSIDITLTADTSQIVHTSFFGDNSHTLQTNRLSSGPFEFLNSMHIHAGGSARQVLHRIELCAR